MISDINSDLNESIEKFKIITEQSLIGIMIIQDGLFKYFNNRVTETTGYSEEEIKSWAPNEFIKVVHPEDREFVREQARKKQAGDPDVVNRYSYRSVRKNGESYWVEVFAKTINYGGRPADLVMTFDITDKIKAEQQLKESEEKFRDIAEQSLMSITILQDGMFKYFNNRVTETTGYSEEEIKSWAPEEFLIKIIHPEDREFMREQARKKQAGDPDVINQYQYRIITKDRRLRWMELFSKIINYEGRPADLVMSIDITEKRIAEQKLKESEEKYRNILETMMVGYYESDLKGNILYVNAEYCNITGYSKEELIGKNFRLFFDKNSNEVLFKIFSQVFKNKTPYPSKGMIKVITGKEKLIYFDGPVDLLYDPEGNKIGFYGLVRDMTERKVAEQNLKESKEKYQQAYNQAEFYKDLFIHDMNNTLQSLFSSIQLIDMDLEDYIKKDDTEGLFEIMYRQIKRGIKLISNVHKLSQLESHDIPLKEVELFEVLNRSIEFIKNTFQERKIQIKIEANSGKISVIGNNLLQDVFENILINSVRHNDNDIVEIIIKISKVDLDDTPYCKLEFIDNGIGIEDERKERVLTRVDLESKKTYGMGLGLSLVKKIIENYNGKIRIEDRIIGDYSKGTNVILLIQKGDS